MNIARINMLAAAMLAGQVVDPLQEPQGYRLPPTEQRKGRDLRGSEMGARLLKQEKKKFAKRVRRRTKRRQVVRV